MRIVPVRTAAGAVLAHPKNAPLTGTIPRLTQLLKPYGMRPAGMTLFLTKVLIPIAVASVAFVLLLGLINMMRGGSPNRSQNLMRMRILLQFIAIVITMAAVWMMGGQQ